MNLSLNNNQPPYEHLQKIETVLVQEWMLVAPNAAVLRDGTGTSVTSRAAIRLKILIAINRTVKIFNRY